MQHRRHARQKQAVPQSIDGSSRPVARRATASRIDSQSRRHPLSESTRPPSAAVPFIPNARGALAIQVLSPHDLLESVSRVTQRPRDALVDLWLATRLHRKLWWTAVRDGRGPNEDRADRPMNLSISCTHTSTSSRWCHWVSGGEKKRTR